MAIPAALSERRARALELAFGKPATPKEIARVAASCGDEDARWAFTQWTLRERARSKFALADEMLFTREALEQATHEAVAAYRASRFPAGAPVIDLTCSIGADLIALARRGPAIGFDLDAERLSHAAVNLAAHGLDGELKLADCLEEPWHAEYAFADPARRSAGRRTVDPEDFQPSPTALAERMIGMKLAAMKLTPMLRDDFLESLAGAVEFWSFGGECREAVVWLGSESERSEPCAIHVETGERLISGEEPYATEVVGGYLFEADPAAIRAHGLQTLCDQFDLSAWVDSNGYLTGDSPAESVWLKAYRVLADGRFDVKAVKAELKSLGSSTPVVKARAKGFDVEATRKALKLEGERELTVVVSLSGKSLRYAIVEPLARPVAPHS